VAVALLATALMACGGGEGAGEAGTPVATATEVASPSPGAPTATPPTTPTATPTETETATPDETRDAATTTPAPASPTTTAASPTATAEPTPAGTPVAAATEAAASEAGEAGGPARGGDPAEGSGETPAPAGTGSGRGGDADDSSGAEAADDAGSGDADMGGDYDEAMEDSVADEGGPASEAYIQPNLSAGEVDDNERWDEYLRFRDQYEGPEVHDVDISERYVISVSDANGRPVPNADVRVSAGETVLFEGRTYANGQTLFFPRAFAASHGAESFTLRVAKGEADRELAFTRGEAPGWDVVLDLEQAAVEGMPLDVLFLLDSTGSMADEIAQIKATLLSISARISDLPSQPDLRLGMVAYRDRGDDFVTLLHDFESEPERFLETIRGVVADGGDDYPESLNEALHVAVHEPQWRHGDAIRLIFLIADAPPHLDYQDDYSYADDMVDAHRRGIKIFSIATSGLDAQGEYIFRQIAQHTMGRFLFVVYGPGGTTSHSVSDYTVERLDDLVVSLVEGELAHLDR
jgi:hypothetical protein